MRELALELLEFVDDVRGRARQPPGASSTCEQILADGTSADRQLQVYRADRATCARSSGGSSRRRAPGNQEVRR